MKSIKLAICLLSSLIGLNHVFAAEDNWTLTSVVFPKLQNVVSGYTTDSGSFRMNTLSIASSVLKVSGGLVSTSSNGTALKCKGYGNTLRASKSIFNNIYNLKGFIYPFADSEIKQLSQKIENTPNLISASVALITTPNSITTEQSAREFEKNLSQVMGSNLAIISQTGEISLNLKSIDDVVCDLALNQAKLEINFTVSFELAKHKRDAIISANDFSLVYEQLKKTALKNAQTSSQNFLNGAMLAQSLKLQLGKSVEDFGKDKFLRLAKGLFDSDLVNLQNIGSDQYEKAARGTDVLTIYYMPVNQKVKIVPQLIGN